MRKLCLCVILALVCASVTAQFEDEFEDFWNNDYDSVYDSDTFAEPADNSSKEKADDDDKKVIEEINMFREANDAAEETDDLEDYQVEDNRSKDKEDSEESSEMESVIAAIENNGDGENAAETEAKVDDDDDKFQATVKNSQEINENDDKVEDNPEEIDENNGDDLANDYALLWGDVQEAETLNKIKEDEERILDETKAILEEESNDSSEFEDSNPEAEKVDGAALQDTDAALQETEEILSQIDNEFDSEGDNKEVQEQFDVEEQEAEDKQADDEVVKEGVDEPLDESNNDETDQKEPSSDEDTVEKAYADLNADLDQLFETLDKLTNDEDKADEPTAEENKPEDNEFDEQRFHDALNMNPLDYEEKYGIPFREGLVLQMRSDDIDYEEVLDDDAEKRLELFDDDVKKTDAEPVTYAQDAFVDTETGDNLNEERYEDDDKWEAKESDDKADATPKVDVDDLTSAEVKDLMGQFTALHKEDLDVHSEGFNREIAPIHMTLKVDEPIVVTSPNYPNPYPTNNIVDWIFEGEGVGIELNITDLAVNGALGDYLLIKPGGIDASGQEGLVFSYRLDSERRYRFMDVDRMFVRFEAKLGMMFFRGFSFTVRMISPLPEEPEPVPEPEPVLTPPTETLTLNLGGVSLLDFHKIQEEFRVLIADMATEYITSNSIDQGMNTTFEITQITRTGLCNLNWPESENCVEIIFGVPLSYEEGAEPRLTSEDLEDMWRTYINRDPFALRLQRLGITEFAIPNERSVLAVWLVIAAGAVISMAMLSLALWRFSCFENYTRMKAYSDTDSVHNEKRTLDLYPTPHQTLPPLYADTEYKWVDDDSTRVDMGGFANKSYSRELYDFDSDDDVIPPRDRTGASGKNYFDA